MIQRLGGKPLHAVEGKGYVDVACWDSLPKGRLRGLLATLPGIDKELNKCSIRLEWSLCPPKTPEPRTPMDGHPIRSISHCL